MPTNSPQIIIIFSVFLRVPWHFFSLPIRKNGFSIFFPSEAFFYYLSFTTSKSVPIRAFRG